MKIGEVTGIYAYPTWPIPTVSKIKWKSKYQTFEFSTVHIPRVPPGSIFELLMEHVLFPLHRLLVRD